MKAFYSLSLGLIFSIGLSAQQLITVTPVQYQDLKDHGQLNPSTQYVIVDPNLTRNNLSDERVPAPTSTQAASCNCMIPLDPTFSVVPFQWGTPPDYRNDDSWTTAMAIPFSFNFFGTMYDSIFINNNGNISFGGGYNSFTATSFPSNQFAMIAPFWADVDTRDVNSGLVYYKFTPTHVIIRWDSVGYYSMHSDKRNTFQLIITDGQDTILPAGTNVGFCYGDMQWTTGDASSGIFGFGGVASTTGVNQGDSISYFQVTRSVDSTHTFDGPYGSDDGVSWLDTMHITFNTALTGNIPPLVMNNTICDTIDVYTGDTIRIMTIDSFAFDFFSLTPEVNQTINTVITTNAPVGHLTYSMSLDSATAQKIHCIFDARNMSPGSYWVTATATDDGSPAQTTSSTVYFNTYYSLTSVNETNATTTVKVYPNPTNNVLNIDHSTAVTEIRVVDLNGSLISKTSATSNHSTIDTRSLDPGIYFVQVLNGDGSIAVNRFVKY